MSFLRQATESILVKRSEFVAGKKDRTSAATVLSGVSCTTPVPLSGDQASAMQQEASVKSIFAIYTTFVAGIQDIRQGDIVEIDSLSYTVKAVSKWPQGRSPFTQVTMEKINP